MLYFRALEERAAEYNIRDIQTLLDSEQFAAAGFSLDNSREKILRAY